MVYFHSDFGYRIFNFGFIFYFGMLSFDCGIIFFFRFQNRFSLSAFSFWLHYRLLTFDFRLLLHPRILCQKKAIPNPNTKYISAFINNCLVLLFIP